MNIFFFFFHILFLIKAQLQDRYKQYDIIDYANLITNTNYKIITHLQTLSTNSNYQFTLHYIHSQLDLIRDVVNNIKPNNMYRYFISVYTTLYMQLYTRYLAIRKGKATITCCAIFCNE